MCTNTDPVVSADSVLMVMVSWPVIAEPGKTPRFPVRVVALGPSSIRLETPAEPAILFFETNRAGELRAAIEKRGGVVSPLQKMNLLKIEMFEVRDPDGHAIWFGESFQHADKPECQTLRPSE